MKSHVLKNSLVAVLRNASFFISMPELEAACILRAACGLSDADILSGAEVDELTCGAALTMARIRAGGEPLDYTVGTSQFYGRELFVGSGALIPRSETESLVEYGVKHLTSGSRWFDWGTGSGCIAVSLALEVPASHGVAMDAHTAALEWARRNIERYGLAERVALRCGWSMEGLEAHSFDLIAANPPYIPTADWEALHDSVRNREPRTALDGGDDGLRCCLEWLAAGGRFLKEGGLFIMETAGPGQCAALRDFEFHGLRFHDVFCDLYGIMRFIVWRGISSTDKIE